MANAGIHRNHAGSNRRTKFVARLFNSEHFLKISSAVQESPQPADGGRELAGLAGWLAAFFSHLMRWTSWGRQRVEQHENVAARPAKRKRRPF